MVGITPIASGPCEVAGAIAGDAHQLMRLLQHAAGRSEHRLALGRGRGAVAAALEHHHAEALLGLRHLRRQRRLADVERIGSGPERAVLGDGDQVLELAERGHVHKRFLSYRLARCVGPVRTAERTIGCMSNAPVTIDIGIGDQDRTAIADGLAHLLADTYTLYLKTHNYHWNVVGPMFNTLHLMFETQYTELSLAVDLIAERIRALGHPAPGTYREFAELSAIAEDTDRPDATEMLRRLVAGQEQVVKTARSIFPVVDAAHDEPTADLLTQRMQVHEKTAWMLRSMLA